MNATIYTYTYKLVLSRDTIAHLLNIQFLPDSTFMFLGLFEFLISTYHLL